MDASLKIVHIYRKSNTYSIAGILQFDDISMIFSGQSPYARALVEEKYIF